MGHYEKSIEELEKKEQESEKTRGMSVRRNKILHARRSLTVYATQGTDEEVLEIIHLIENREKIKNFINAVQTVRDFNL